MISRPASERIVQIDEFEMRLAAVEQRREQSLEMPVDRLERGEQADASFAVEIADRSAQAVDGLRQFLNLGGILRALGIRVRPVRRRRRVDRARAARGRTTSRSCCADSAWASPTLSDSNPAFCGSSGGGHSKRSPDSAAHLDAAQLGIFGRAIAPARVSRAAATRARGSPPSAVSASRSAASAARSCASAAATFSRSAACVRLGGEGAAPASSREGVGELTASAASASARLSISVTRRAASPARAFQLLDLGADDRLSLAQRRERAFVCGEGVACRAGVGARALGRLLFAFERCARDAVVG